MDYYISVDSNGKTLCHFGIRGQKWGVRRYQNSDGSWTEEGKRHRQNYDEYTSRKKNYYDELDRVGSQSKSIQQEMKSVGHKGSVSSYVKKYVDDDELVDSMLQDDNINIDKLVSLKKSMNDFYRENKESINIGKSLVESMIETKFKGMPAASVSSKKSQSTKTKGDTTDNSAKILKDHAKLGLGLAGKYLSDKSGLTSAMSTARNAKKAAKGVSNVFKAVKRSKKRK